MEDRKLTVRAVERALDILMCFTKSSELGLTEIAGQIGLHKSTVHRLMTTLEEKGFVARDAATEKYRLGLKVWELSTHLSKSDDPAVLLLPAMERLRDRLGETVSLYLRDGKDRLRIQAVQSNQAIRRVAQVGARLPLYVGASSKVLVAFASEEDRTGVVRRSGMAGDARSGRLPPHAGGDPGARIRDQLRRARAGSGRGCRADREPEGEVAAALSVSGPISRIGEDTLHEFAPVLMEAAHEMGLMI